jgi:hypothetical protein
MRKAKRLAVSWFAPVMLAATLALAQQPAAPAPNPGMSDMPGMDSENSGAAMHSMDDRHMDMGPHMKMTSLRPPQPGDAERANQVVEVARRVATQYEDYHTALKDGFRIFLPNLPQKMYHFTNYRYALEAEFHFNPEHPTSLLYEKRGDGYKLIGLMYTAPKSDSEEELNQRIPLSVAQWHEHVNMCFPPKDKRWELLAPHPQFGPAGSISTREACEAAGGRFRPLIFGWMVHVYPFERNPDEIWSVERQMHGQPHAD